MNIKPTLTFLCFLVPLMAAAAPSDAFEIYANLTGKTVLRPSMLPLVSDAVLSDLPTESTNAIAHIETEFSKQGIAAVQDGPHFVIILPEKERGLLTNGLTLRGNKLALENSKETMPAGIINFSNLDAPEVLALYASIGHRTVLRQITLHALVHLKTTCAMTREEALYAMSTVLALNGVAVMEDGEKFIQAVPIFQRSMVNLHAPKADPAAKLLDPSKAPSLGDADPLKPISKMEHDLERWRKAFYEFMHYKAPPERPAQRLLDLYASLAEKTAETSTNFDRIPISFHIDTPLTKDELIYAIEATFDLNWLKVVHVDDQRIRLDRLTDRGPHPGKRDAKHDLDVSKASPTSSHPQTSTPQRLPSLYKLRAGTALIGPTNLPNSTPVQLSLIRRGPAKDYKLGNVAFFRLSNGEDRSILLYNVRVQVRSTNTVYLDPPGWETVVNDYPEGTSKSHILPGASDEMRVKIPTRAPWRVCIVYSKDWGATGHSYSGDYEIISEEMKE